MAHIVGYQRGSARKIPVAHIFLIVVVAFSLVGFMLVSEENWRDHIVSLLCTVAVILVLVGFALNKVNPMGWKRLLKKAEYEQHLQGDRKIVKALESLDDDYTVLCGFTFELIYVEFLVLGPHSMFVVGKTTAPETIRAEDGVLMAGGTSLAKLTGNLWRISHLVNLVVKKGYGVEIVPKPILVATCGNTIEVDEFEGISVVKAEELALTVEQHATMDIPSDLVRGFTAYLEQRYIK